MDRENIKTIISYFLGGLIGLTIGIFIGSGIRDKTMIDQKAIIEEQQGLINSYVEFVKQKCPDKECDCSWYEDFYYEHAEEMGAYE